MIAGIGRLLAVLAVLVCAAPGNAAAQEAVRLAGPGALVAGGEGLALDLPLTRAAPWRARLWAEPARAVIEVQGLDLTGLALAPAGPAVAVRSGTAGGDWARLVIELDRPMGFSVLAMAADPATGTARLTARLIPVEADEFDRQARALAPGQLAALPVPASATAATAGRTPFRVMLDPGHGGIDPGASHGGLSESALTLAFARDLAHALTEVGGFEVTLSRDADRFVSLETRIRLARAAGAQVFVSLHADALEDGQAEGITLYTLADAATDAASAALAERHDRADLLGGGADLTGIGDDVARVLMDVARTETRPRTERLVQALIGAIRGAELRLHRHPWQEAAFAVLKAPDIPSVLIELGFLSNPADRARLVDPAWRARMIAALVAGLAHWRDDEAGRALLVRQ